MLHILIISTIEKLRFTNTEVMKKININDSVTLTCSLGTIDEGFTNIAVCEHTWSTDIVPILTCEWINTKYGEQNRCFNILDTI